MGPTHPWPAGAHDGNLGIWRADKEIFACADMTVWVDPTTATSFSNVVSSSEFSQYP